MLKLCSQGLLLLIAIGALALSLSQRNENIPQAVSKAPDLESPLPADAMPRNQLSAEPFPGQSESRVAMASAADPLSQLNDPSPGSKPPPETTASAHGPLPAHPNPPKPLLRNTPPPQAPITNAEAEALAVAILKSIVSNDPQWFRAQFDLGAFAARALPAFDSNTVEARQLRAALEDKFDQIGPQLLDLQFHYIRSCASYHYLRTVHREDGPQLILRLVSDDGLLNYHEYLLVQGPQGVRAADLFVYASGEPLSLTLQRAAVILLSPDQQSELASLSKPAAATIREALRLEYMNRPLSSRDYEGVLAIYASLPADLRLTRPIQAMRLSAARKVSDTEHKAAVDEYQKLFPNDPSTYLKYLHPQRPSPGYPDFHRALDRLDEFVGGDPYLQTLRASAASGTSRHSQ